MEKYIQDGKVSNQEFEATLIKPVTFKGPYFDSPLNNIRLLLWEKLHILHGHKLMIPSFDRGVLVLMD